MKMQSLNNGYAIRTLSPKPNCSAELKLPANVRSCAPEQDLRGQSVAIVGLGKSGRAAARLALARGASVFAFDQNPNLRLLEGKQVMSELDFAAEILPESVKILAVTGTNGKSTVVTFAGQVAVVEVSSYQMEIPSKYFCPSVAVVLNLTPDHLERHGTMRDYAQTKCRLFFHMTGAKLGLLCFGNQYLDEAIIESLNELNLAWIGAIPGVKIDMETKIASLEVPALGVNSQLQLGAMKTMGGHNFHNAAVAALSVVGLNVGVDVEAIGPCIEKLRAPPHRMQIVCKDIHGVTWVDDSKATNVEATYTGLMDLKKQKSVVLLGGLAKVLDGQECNGFERLIEPLKYQRCVITFGSSGMLIQKTLSDNGLSIPCIRAVNLKDAVNWARRMAEHGDSIVLSPGCASFDEFRNFEHRGMFFQDLAFTYVSG
ncbi:UDP-N-acetylmuramoylalanine--D-glutamate ligase isoform X6 [Pyrus x bretschneideri]|uniref:UDP-N-acetylmuramoylalanine--D-glutamate ligase isoform X6 n=1 Tax=Pyrus x bretschneideri TaxID=225117 RepID=UPI002030DB1D|nr:UDP-N-acetylmuramoylalanine--D-glutamate ligase isoform X6 [Pyrus x bretschneideri]